MSNQRKNIIEEFDLWLIDRVFQPIANRLPGERMNLRLGMNLILGSVIFSFAFMLLPIFFFGLGPMSSTYNFLSCIMMICFYMYVHRNISLVKEKFANPLRYYLAGIRIISIPFTLYGIYVWLTSYGMISRFTLLYCISNILSVIGLYFVSCNISPPKKQEQRKMAFSQNPFS